jgi:hypothetical protein
VVINGNVSASSTAFGIEYFSSVGTPVTITGRVTSTSGAPAIYSGTNTCVVHLRGGYDTAANARHPFANATVRLHPTDAIRCDYRTYNTATLADLSTRSLYSGGVNVGHPATSDVRSGTVFGGASEYTGTLAVPSPTLVAIGVPTDNTVGSYAPSGGLDENDLHDALDSYPNKDSWKATGFTTPADLPADFETLTITDGAVTAELDSASQAQIDAIETFATRMTTGLVQDGLVWQFTANMLELGPSGSSTVAVLPAVGIVAERTAGTTLLPVIGETISQAITVYQSDGTTPVDLSGKTLSIIFETLGGADVAVVASGDISIGGANDNVVTFAYPSAVTASERTLRFAIRDAAAPLTMYLQGVCSVVNAPKADA